MFDLKGKLVKDVGPKTKEEAVQGRNTASVSLSLDSMHVADFLDAIRNNRKPNCDVEIGHKSIIGMQLSNIAWRVGRELQLDPKNGHILNDPQAQKLWKRSYEQGWEPKA
ncbi:hypothetical protein D3C78_1629020 [compost metagenome]